MLLTFGGLDGAGKSTHINLLVDWLESHGCKVDRLWARGGYTPGFELIKRFLRNLLGKRLPAPGKTVSREKKLARLWVAKLWLTIAIIDLILFWGVFLRFQRFKGHIIVCDRYLDDTRLDFKQNFPHVDFEEMFIWQLLEWMIPRPDVSFLLWVSVNESIERGLLKNEPFPDDSKTLEWRLSSYMDQKQFSSNKYLKIECSDDLGIINKKITQEVQTFLDGKI